VKRTQIQLEEHIYDSLRRRAFQEKKSIAGVIREIITKEIAPPGHLRPSSIQDFAFIAADRSGQGALKPVSERHDEALEGAFQK
jgi:hypothetical protein